MVGASDVSDVAVERSVYQEDVFADERRILLLLDMLIRMKQKLQQIEHSADIVVRYEVLNAHCGQNEYEKYVVFVASKTLF